MSDTSNAPDPTDSAPKGANGLDMASIMSTYNTALGQVQQSATDLTSALATGRQGIQNEQAGSVAGTQAQQEINTITGAAKSQQQADDAEAAAHFGTNPHAASYSIGALGDEVLALHNDISQRRSAISDKLNQSFLDAPIQWMVNQFTLPIDVATANLKIGQANSDLDTIHELEQATREQAATNAMIDQVDGTVAAAKQNELLAAQVQINLGKSQQQLATLGIQGITLKDAISKTQLESMFQLNNAISEKERLDIEQAKLPGIIAAKNEAILRTKLIIEEKQTSDANKLDIQSKLNSFTSTMGMAPVTFDQFKGMQGRMRDILEQGILDPDTYSGRIPGASAGPVNAINIANSINAPLTAGMNDIRNKVGKIMDTVAADNPTLAGKPELITLQNAATKAVIERDIKNIPTESSIYSPLSLKALISASPAIQDNPLIPYLANQAVADELYPTNPNDMFNAAYKAVTAGTMTIDTATNSITELYRTMQLQLNQIKAYPRYGFSRLDDTTGYRQSVYVGQGPGSTRVVDLTDTADVQNALVRSIIGKGLIDSTGAIGTGGVTEQLLNQPAGKIKKVGVQ